MSYIELNGKSSLDVQGLLIQSLAPITKPKVRTETTEIDGRDGDIITRLGYSAYDKEISIGLSWNYDIDEVIQYFVDNDKGTVLFSNEEDKLYKYEILDQIDFERLIRFKTAKVKFHVQPFKISSIEKTKTFNTLKDKGSAGFTVTIENNDNYAISKIIINGYSVLANGKPSTTNRSDIISVGESGTINITRKSGIPKIYSIPISEPLRALISTSDAIDKEKIYRYVGKYKFTGEENWRSDNVNGYAYLMFKDVPALSNIKKNGDIISNYFNRGASGEKGTIFAGESAIAINYSDDVINVDSLKSLLKNYDVYCLFELSKEVEQELTQEQKSVMESIDLDNGTNEFYCDYIHGTLRPFMYVYVKTQNEFYLRNSGNYFSRPTISIYGSGTIHLYINNFQVLLIDLGDNTQITIDSNEMEAYNKETGVYMNRLVSGDYNDIKLKVGKNSIKWDGDITKMEITNFSRWI